MQIIQILLALPKIWEIIKELMALVDKHNEAKHQEAVAEQKKAKTPQEIEDATRKLVDNP